MIKEFFTGFALLLGCFAVLALGAFLIRRFTGIRREPFRKLLHFILLFSLLVFLYAFKTWQQAALAALLFAAFEYPLLAWGEKAKGYPELLAERKQGEIKKSLVLVFGMFALLISICWGWLNDQMLAVASIFAWGFGDAAAALVGKRFGCHILQGKLIEGRKSVEGTFAMFVAASLLVFASLMLRGGMTMNTVVFIAAVAGAVCAAVELYTLHGYDTVTCPLSAAAVIIPLVKLFEGVSL